MRKRFGGLTVVFVPDEGGASRSFRFSPQALRLTLLLALVVVVGTAAMATSWWFLAVKASQSVRLQTTVDSLLREQARVLVLADQLERVEAEYDRIRLLFGSSADPISPDLWLPPAGLPRAGRPGGTPSSEAYLPTAWPLTEAGFITRSLVEGEAEDHPGLDIAIGADAYVRASGEGRVLRIGEDPIYGLFVVLEHGEGFQTVYAHASMILVVRGQRVRRGEVIALTGSTGRSTAPHLHFEILLDGVPLDPLSMVEQPS
jgi:murein DD-endopeptidase MepM/ murein hydrolase activator NlpD